MVIAPVYGIVEDAVYVPDGTILEETFVVKVLKRRCYLRGQAPKIDVLVEKHFQKFPTDEQIMWCIARYKGDQATVEKVYSLAKIPFTEDEGEQGECQT